MTHFLLLLVAGILATSPANAPDGRLLTVAESVGQADHSLSPAQVRAYWTPDSQITRELQRPQRPLRPAWKLPEPEGPGK